MTAFVDGPVICMGVTGMYVEPLNLQPDDINVYDIAHHLGNQCRYSGATREFYSVGQHVVLCAREMEARDHSAQVVYTTLHHDDAEAFLQDVARPLKEEPYFGKAYRGAESRAERVIADVLGFDFPYPPEIKEMDTILLATERRDLMPPKGKWRILEGVTPLEAEVVPWSPKKARAAYIQMHDRLVRRLNEE